jgi:hypothetical protein
LAEEKIGTAIPSGRFQIILPGLQPPNPEASAIVADRTVIRGDRPHPSLDPRGVSLDLDTVHRLAVLIRDGSLYHSQRRELYNDVTGRRREVDLHPLQALYVESGCKSRLLGVHHVVACWQASELIFAADSRKHALT